MRLGWTINAALSRPLRAVCVSVVFILTAVFAYRYYAERQLQKRLHEQAEAEEQLRDMLDQIVSLQLEDRTPLRSWLAEFTKQTQIPVELVIDPAALRPDLTLDLPVILTLSPLPAYEWLQTLGELHDLSWLVRSDGTVVLINNDFIKEDLQYLKQYPPLVQPNLPIVEQSDLVTSLIDPHNWYDLGGACQMEQSTIGLLARQTHQNHRRTANFLCRLGEAHQYTTALPVAGLLAADPSWEPFWLDGEAQQIARLQQALERPITLRVIDMPVDDFAALLTKQAGFPVIMHPRHFFEPDGTQILVTCELKGVPLKHALREWQSNDAYEFKPAAGGRLLVVFNRSPDDGTLRETLFAYPIPDLNANVRGSEGVYLIDLLNRLIEHDAWVNGAGNSEMISTADGKLLLVFESFDNHRRIQEVLRQLRRVRNGETRVATCQPDPPLRAHSAEREQRLNRSMSLYFCGVDDARAFEEICIRGDIRLPRLEENGIVGSGRVWCNLPAQPLRDNLELLFTAKGHDLRYLEQATTPEEMILYDDSQLQVTEVFDLRPWLTAGNTTLNVDELIRKIVYPETWTDNGGSGHADIFRQSLVVQNHPRVTRRVRDLLSALEGYAAVGQAKQWRGEALTVEALNRPLELWSPNDPEVLRQKKFAARNAEIKEKLKQRVSVSIQHKELRTALLELAREYQLPIILHQFPSLEDFEPGNDPFSGLSTRCVYVSLKSADDKVNFEARDQPLGEVLQQLIGDPSQLVWQVSDGHLTVTTPALKFVDQTSGYLYCVDDLLLPRGSLRPKQLIRTLEMAVLDTDGDGDVNDESQSDPQVVSLDFHFGNLLWFNQDQSSIDRTRFEALLRDLRSGKLKAVETLKGDSDYSKPYSRKSSGGPCISTIPIVGARATTEVQR